MTRPVYSALLDALRIEGLDPVHFDPDPHPFRPAIAAIDQCRVTGDVYVSLLPADVTALRRYVTAPEFVAEFEPLWVVPLAPAYAGPGPDTERPTPSWFTVEDTDPRHWRIRRSAGPTHTHTHPTPEV
jgi:hypothetical protein